MINNQDILIIIQARTGSTRLPNKMLIPFANGKTILEIIVERLKLFVDLPIIIATTQNKADDALEELAKSLKVDFYRGAENDVLNRFVSAAEYAGAKRIIRVCADNPFLNALAMNELVLFASQSSADYISFRINGKPSIKTHFGFWGEYVTLDALKKVASKTGAPLYREHVTNYVYEHPELFKNSWINSTQSLEKREDIRLTIDTKTDFENVSNLYKIVYEIYSNPTLDEVVSILDKYPLLLKQMKFEIIKNTK
ncbi:MAG: NTP transferase domain-containing protein [Bacteroidetes bacterium]|nr:NTP transferase domain-containing protein [Bacteroidota bacterium]